MGLELNISLLGLIIVSCATMVVTFMLISGMVSVIKEIKRNRGE